MGKIRQIANNLKSWDLMTELDKILMELSDTIVGMNKEQLSIGEDAEGGTLEPYADPQYAIDKVELFGSKAPLGIPNLKFSGDFYNGFTIVFGNNKLSITSSDLKTLRLEGKYGDIFGLQPNNLTELAHKFILPRLAQSYLQNFKT
jgi:hypothetical protein